MSEAPIANQIPVDWRMIRDVLEAVDPKWKPSTRDGQKNPKWVFATNLIQTYRAKLQVKCVGCGVERSPFDFYRCWDCKSYLCEDCIKGHFGPRHQPHPKTLAQHEARAESAIRERDEARAKLFPYADATEISGMSWGGFYLIGDKKSIAELRRIENRSAHIDVFRQVFDECIAAEKERADAAQAALRVMREALDHAEAVMSIVEPRSDKAEYLKCLAEVRSALASSGAAK